MGVLGLEFSALATRSVANPIDRYAIGDRDAVGFNADGSLDIYIQHDNPGAFYGCAETARCTYVTVNEVMTPGGAIWPKVTPWGAGRTPYTAKLALEDEGRVKRLHSAVTRIP